MLRPHIWIQLLLRRVRQLGIRIVSSERSLWHVILRALFTVWNNLTQKQGNVGRTPFEKVPSDTTKDNGTISLNSTTGSGYATHMTISASNVPTNIPSAPLPSQIPFGNSLHLHPSASSSSLAAPRNSAVPGHVHTRPSTPRAVTDATGQQFRPGSSLGHTSTTAQGRTIAASRSRTPSLVSLRDRRGAQSRTGPSRPTSWHPLGSEAVRHAGLSRAKRSNLSIRSNPSVNVVPPPLSPPTDEDTRSERQSVLGSPVPTSLGSSANSFASSNPSSPQRRFVHILPGSNASPQQATPAHLAPVTGVGSSLFELLEPISTGDVQYLRYTDCPQIPSSVEDPSVFIIPAGTHSFERALPRASDWKRCVHPEGSVYWFHEQLRIYTPSDLFDLAILDAADRFASILPRAEESDYTIIIEVDEAGQPTVCKYYIAHHQSRAIYWLHEYNATDILSELGGFVDVSHFKYEFESLYWMHRELFPHYQEVNKLLLKELLGLLTHASYDALTSRYSTVAYSAENFSDMVNHVKTLTNIANVGAYASCVVARMMGTLAHEQYINYAGQRCARLNRDQAVFYDLVHSQSLYFKLVSLLLFRAPHIQAKQLETIWVDHLINHVPWRAFIQRAKEDWRDIILNATVLLAVNMALLAIPTVDNTDNNEFQSYRNPVQILSYLSTLTSVGTIIIGLALIRKYNHSRNTAEDAANHLGRQHGLDTLAVMHSLPYAGLLWAMVTFLASFLVMTFDRTHTPTRVTVAFVCVLVCGLVLWCTNDAWDRGALDRLVEYLKYFTSKLSIFKSPIEEEERSEDEMLGGAINNNEASSPDNHKKWTWHRFAFFLPISNRQHNGPTSQDMHNIPPRRLTPVELENTSVAHSMA